MNKKSLFLALIFLSLIANLSAMDMQSHVKYHNPAIKYNTEQRWEDTWILAEDGQTTAGFIKFKDNKIEQLHTQEAYRGQDIGAILFIECLRQIKAKGYKKAEWFASRSMNYYLRFGSHAISAWRKPREKEISALMEYDFEKCGDPIKNLKEFKKKQTKNTGKK